MDLDPYRDEVIMYNISGTIIQRFSKNDNCGVRVLNVGKHVEGAWYLNAIDYHKTVDRDVFKLDVLIHIKEPSIKNVSVSSNNPSIRFQCPNSNSARYCRLWDPDYIQFDDKCEAFPTILSEKSVYTCATTHWGEMEETISQVHIYREKADVRRQAEVTENEYHILLTCNNPSTSCRAEKPNGSQLLISDGLLSFRYSAYDTQLNR